MVLTVVQQEMFSVCADRALLGLEALHHGNCLGNLVDSAPCRPPVFGPQGRGMLFPSYIRDDL